ncbi:type II toxin-antitoxin system RelE/ParE family toxin [Patescibacteria group bacterium]
MLKEDFKKISNTEKRKIVKTIKKKLSKNPQEFGKPLKGKLKGYFRLRINFYRVIYRIDKGKIRVLIIKVGLRKNLKAYIQAAKRLGLIK